MNLALLFSVAFGGSIGATLRYVISYAVAQRTDTLVPLGTLIVNIVGSFSLGALIEFSERIVIDPNLRAFLTVGIFGALTTFSTFTLETIYLLRDREWQPAILNVVLSLVAGLAACVAGILFARVALRLFGDL